MAEELSEEGDEVGAVGRTEMGKSVQSVRACVCVCVCGWVGGCVCVCVCVGGVCVCVFLSG